MNLLEDIYCLFQNTSARQMKLIRHFILLLCYLKFQMEADRGYISLHIKYIGYIMSSLNISTRYSVSLHNKTGIAVILHKVYFVCLEVLCSTVQHEKNHVSYSTTLATYHIVFTGRLAFIMCLKLRVGEVGT